MSLKTEQQLVVNRVVALLTIASSLLWFSWVGLNRLVARDEGFYVYAVKLVLGGQTPYLDFFYPQMPLLPYFYTPFIAAFGESWQVLRLTNGVLNTAIAWMIFSFVSSRANNFFAFLAV